MVGQQTAVQQPAHMSGPSIQAALDIMDRIRAMSRARLGERGCAAMVWAAVLIVAAGNSVVRWLSELGGLYPLDGRNPITPCNILLVGSFCAFLVLTMTHGGNWTRANLRSLGRRDWFGMIVGAVLSSALGPAFTLLALENTSVTNLVLIGRLEPLLFLVLSAFLLGQAVDRFALAGMLVTIAGAGLAFVLAGSGALPAFGQGEIYAALAAASFAGSTIVSRMALARVPFGIFIVFRMGVAVIVFFWTAVYLYGFQHFAGVRSPFLWQAMAVYGTLFVVAAQLCWFGGLRLARPADISLAGAFSPVAAIMFALVILGETPTPALVAGGAVILVGIAIGQFGRYALHTVLAWRGWLSRGDRSFRPARLSTHRPSTGGRR